MGWCRAAAFKTFSLSPVLIDQTWTCPPAGHTAEKLQWPADPQATSVNRFPQNLHSNTKPTLFHLQVTPMRSGGALLAKGSTK